MTKKILEEELKGITESLELDNLTDDEKQELLDDAIQQFEQMPGVSFDEMSDDETKNIENDFKTTRKILTKNIDRLEKLTGLMINNIAIDTNNVMSIQTAMSVMSESSKAIKLLAELQNKMYTNKQALKKVNDADGGEKSPNNKLPENWVVK